jgi:Bacterial Ig-like domain (group 3)
MSRAIHRLLVTAAVGGIAVLPTLAFAADASPGDQPQMSTTITVGTPKHAPIDGETSLTARITAADTDGDTGTDGEAGKPRLSARSDAGQGDSDDSTAKKGKGHKKKAKGGHHQKHHAAETGTVTFTVDGKAQPPIQVERDHATEKIQLSPGNHTVAATYSGDGHYRASRSIPVTFSVS